MKLIKQEVSSLLETSLFLGFFITPDYQLKLAQFSPFERDLLIQNDSPSYLQQIETVEGIYLGKFLEPPISITAIEFSYSHLLSLLRKLVPDYFYNKESFSLLSVPYASNYLPGK